MSYDDYRWGYYDPPSYSRGYYDEYQDDTYEPSYWNHPPLAQTTHEDEDQEIRDMLAYLIKKQSEEMKKKQSFFEWQQSITDEVTSITERVAILQIQADQLANFIAEKMSTCVVDEIVNGEYDGEEEGLQEIEQATLDSIDNEPLEVDMVNMDEEEEVLIKEVDQEDSYLVEPEIIDFIFAPINYEIYEKARLLSFLPKIFSFSRRHRKRKYSTPCHVHSRVASPLANKPEPSLYQDYTQVRGWSINDLKWPWHFKVNLMFEAHFGLGVSRLRSFSCLSVWK